MSESTEPSSARIAPDDARARRLGVTFALGFASGLPLALSSGTLTYFLARYGVSPETIGVFGLAGAPYTYKFLWSPLLDRLEPRPFGFLGRRRGWLLLVQLALVACIAATGFSDPLRAPTLTALGALGIAFFSASQDVVIDALRVETLAVRDQGWGAALTMWGYRLGMLASGWGALRLADSASFHQVYWTMAGLALLGSAGTWLAIEPPRREDAAQGGDLASAIGRAVVEPFRSLSAKHPLALIALFLVVFRLGDTWAGQMTNPYFVGAGFTGAEIADVTKLFGVIATVVGVGIGGFVLARADVARCLPYAAIIMAVSNVGYAWLATRGHDVASLTIAVTIENVTSGIGQSITVAWLSSLCDRGRAATQYALLTALISASRTHLVAASGYVKTFADGLAESLGLGGRGWSIYFAITVLAGLPGIVLAWILSRRSAEQRAQEGLEA